jgi:GTP:adenosylcobinamide-phosphate guanylyltransferase
VSDVRVAVMAGGRGSRLGDSKATVSLGAEPLLSWVLRAALEEEASLRATLRRLAPARIDVPWELVASINTPEDLAAAERRLSQPAVVQPDAREAAPPAPDAPRHPTRRPA